jgi:hypothetical protein
MIDYPRLRDPLLSTLLAGLCFLLAWKIDRFPEWLRMFLAFMGVVFSATAIVTGIDFLVYRIGARLEEFSLARYAGAVRFASALKGLTMSQTDMVQRQMATNIAGIPGDAGPVWVIRGQAGDVPLAYAVDFFEWSKQTAPYLWPVRRGSEVGGGDGWSNGVQYAQELTRSVISNGWAKQASGPYAAILTEPLETVASKYGVET